MGWRNDFCTRGNGMQIWGLVVQIYLYAYYVLNISIQKSLKDLSGMYGEGLENVASPSLGVILIIRIVYKHANHKKVMLITLITY